MENKGSSTKKLHFVFEIHGEKYDIGIVLN